MKKPMLLQIKTSEKVVTDPQEIKHALVKTIGARFLCPHQRNKQILMKDEYLCPMGKDTLCNAGDVPSREEMESVFRQMANKKTPQEDMISKELVQIAPKSIKNVIYQWIMDVFESGRLLKEDCVADVLLL